MCGIAGIFNPTEITQAHRAAVSAMVRTQTHRGPDDHGEYHGSQISLGHNRLSIIDLSAGRPPADDQRRQHNPGNL